MTVKTSFPGVDIWVNSQNSQLTDFDHYCYQQRRFLVKVGGGGDGEKSTQPTIIVKRLEQGPST